MTVQNVIFLIVLLILLGGVDFVPAPAFTPQARSGVSLAIVALFFLWLMYHPVALALH